jgi:hypothetical protein
MSGAPRPGSTPISGEHHAATVTSATPRIVIKTEGNDMVVDSSTSSVIIKREEDDMAVDNTAFVTDVKTESNPMEVENDTASATTGVYNPYLDRKSQPYSETHLCRVLLQRWNHEKFKENEKLTDYQNSHLIKIIHYLGRLGENAKPLLVKFKMAKALKTVLKHTQLIGESIPRQIVMLLDAWDAGQYNPAPGDHAAISDDDSDIETDASLSDDKSDAESIDSFTDAMRGIIVKRGRNGMKVYTVDKAYHRPASVFGHNCIKVGDWWPLQICALRDGAHGSRMGGIAGKANLGAYSVIISGGGGYKDTDEGHTVWYTGSGKDGEDQTLTTGNQALINSSHTRYPVRVLRASKATSSRFAPSSGLRYDGLYEVAEYDYIANQQGHMVYKFKLVRSRNQEDIKLNVPTPADLRKLRRHG